MRFHHIAVATENIEQACAALDRYCPTSSSAASVLDPEQGVRLKLVNILGTALELVEDQGDGPVGGWLKRGARLYHICFEVDDLDAELDILRGRGCIVVSPPKPAVLFEGRRVAFVLDRELGLIELLQNG